MPYRISYRIREYFKTGAVLVYGWFKNTNSTSKPRLYSLSLINDKYNIVVFNTKPKTEYPMTILYSSDDPINLVEFMSKSGFILEGELIRPKPKKQPTKRRRSRINKKRLQ